MPWGRNHLNLKNPCRLAHMFAEKVEEAKTRFTFSEKAAVLYVLLKGLDNPSAETKELLAALESQTMDQLRDPWLKKFALSIFNVNQTV